jgi:hypothetical protein
MPKVLLRPSSKVAQSDQQRERVVRQLDEARFGRGHLLIPVDEVVPNANNPRTAFDQQALNELAESIKRWDQLQPIIVRRLESGYQIVAGERRWRATKLAGKERIWAVERNVSDADAFKLALIENLHRVDLSQSERVAALDQLDEYVDEAGLRATARELHVTHGWLCSQLKLRKDPVIFPALEAGHLSFAQASELRLAPAHARRNLVDRALRDRPSAMVMRSWVNEVKQRERAAHAAIDRRLAVSVDASLRPLNFEYLVSRFQALETLTDEEQRRDVRAIASECQRLLGDPGVTSVLDLSTRRSKASRRGTSRI